MRHVVPVHFRRRGGDVRLVLHGRQEGSSDARLDPALVKAIVCGRLAKPEWMVEIEAMAMVDQE